MSFALLLVATVLVSRATGVAGVPAHDDSIDASISADGRYVAFASIADNLATRTTTRAQRLRARPADGHHHVRQPGERRGGRGGATGSPRRRRSPRTAASSRSTSGSDEPQRRRRRTTHGDVFVRDLQSEHDDVRQPGERRGRGRRRRVVRRGVDLGRRTLRRLPLGRRQPRRRPTTTRTGTSSCATCSRTRRLVSRADAPARRQLAHEPSISADGRYVAFESFAAQPQRRRRRRGRDIFVRDLQAEHDDVCEPWRRRGMVRGLDLRRRPPGGVRLGLREARARRRRREPEHLRARPRGRHDQDRERRDPGGALDPSLSADGASSHSSRRSTPPRRDPAGPEHLRARPARRTRPRS